MKITNYHQHHYQYYYYYRLILSENNSSSSSLSMGSTPVGVQCLISSSLGEFPSYWDWLWCPVLSPVGLLVSIALPFAFHTWCFPFALIYHWISIAFLLYGRRIAIRHPFGQPFTCSLLGEFPGLGLALVPDVAVPEADSGAHRAENSIQISVLAGVHDSKSYTCET